jgi:hypothetical protein
MVAIKIDQVDMVALKLFVNLVYTLYIQFQALDPYDSYSPLPKAISPSIIGCNFFSLCSIKFW